MREGCLCTIDGDAQLRHVGETDDEVIAVMLLLNHFTDKISKDFTVADGDDRGSEAFDGDVSHEACGAFDRCQGELQ